MLQRQTFLRMMLWLLGLAAVAGVLGVFGFSSSVAWRVIGTLSLGAVACAILLLGSYLAERPGLRPAGLWLMGATVVEYLGILALIWEIFPRHREWAALASSLAAWPLTAVWVMLVLAAGAKPAGVVASRFGVGLACVALPLWLMGIWSDFGSVNYHAVMDMYQSANATWLFGIAATFVLLDYSRRRWWMWLGIATATMGWSMRLGEIWWKIEGLGDIIGCAAALVAFLAYLSILRLILLPARFDWCKRAAGYLALGTMLVADGVILTDVRGVMLEPLTRLLAASAIVTACASLAVVILRLLCRRESPPTELFEIRRIEIVCPGCGKKGAVAVGASRCAQCRLEFDIRIREPRCPACNYLLYRLVSDRCPECGTALADRSGDPASTL